MKPPYITDSFLRQFIQNSLLEDVGDGDHSTLAAIPEDHIHQARLIVKQEGVLAGVELVREIFHQFDPRLDVDVKITDGSDIKPGDIAFTVGGPARSILTTERLVLNCLQRMSGIATKTKQLSGLLAGTGAKLLDTRKTTPNFRLLEKWAVVIGGGKNHRIGLYDMVMLKDNHIDMAGGIEKAIIRTKDYLRATKRELRIEVETRTIDEVKEVLRIGGVDVVLLDNMSVETLRQAVSMINGRFETEASGGITEATVKSIAETGVTYISVGALTHTIASLDLSLKAF